MPSFSSDTLIQALRKIELFSTLSEPQIERLVPFCGLRTIRKGESIFLQGEPSPYCFGVLQGRVEIVRVTRDRKGPTKRLGEFGPGEFFGESSLFIESARTATATASEDGELLTLTGSKLREWIYANPVHSLPLVMHVLQHSLDRLHSTSQELAVVYGIERLLGSGQPFEHTLPQAIHFLEQAFPGVDVVQLYEHNISWDEFSVATPSDDQTRESLAMSHPFVIRMQETDGATLLTRHELDAWRISGKASQKKSESAMAVSLWDRDRSPRTLAGFLIVTSGNPGAHFAPEDLRLLSAVASPLAEALLRYRRQQDAQAHERLQRARMYYPK